MSASQQRFGARLRREASGRRSARTCVSDSLPKPKPRDPLAPSGPMSERLRGEDRNN